MKGFQRISDTHFANTTPLTTAGAANAVSDTSKRPPLSEAALKANKLLIAKREGAAKSLRRFKKHVFKELCEFHGLPTEGTIKDMAEQLVQKVNLHHNAKYYVSTQLVFMLKPDSGPN